MIERAFDALRFGHERTLNLRALMPTASQAAELAEPWLRRLQVEGAGEALVITGRGNRSEDGVSVVRAAVAQRLSLLRRKNVLAGFTEHTPGSFVVTFAPVRALAEAPRRRRDVPVAPPVPPTLAALSPETVALLAQLAAAALAALGVRAPTRAQVEDEMTHQYAMLTTTLPTAGDREALLRQAVQRALNDYETEP